MDSVKDGKTFGALIIPQNFTTALTERSKAKQLQVSDQVLNDSTIKFMGDLTGIAF